MKLVIEIPEKTNAHIRSDYGHGVKGLRDKDMEIVFDAIYHGIPVREKIDNICHIVHSAILSSFESHEEERPFTKEELLLLRVNKAICTEIKKMGGESE